MEKDMRIPKKKITFTGKLLDYKEFRPCSDNFLETGTAAGDGVQRAIDAGFIEVCSCEAAEKWFNQSYDRFKFNDNVKICQAESKEFLRIFVSRTLPQVIFLDAHPAGPESAFHKELMEEGPESEWNQDRIIKAELDIILERYKKHVIIIDDVNGLEDGHAEEYMEIMLRANPDYKFYFYDENLSGNAEHYYKDKILVAIP